MTTVERADSQYDLVELFELFGNDTRRKILQTLWANFNFDQYITESREGMQFSELREEVGVSDSGNFNYHLGKLEGTLLTKRDGAYVLTPLGYNLMRSITELTSFRYETRGQTVLDTPCPFCHGALVAEYSRELLTVRCQDCDALSSGRLTTVGIRATAHTDLDMPQLLDRATLNLFSKLRKSRYGICWDCLDTLDREIVVCETHEHSTESVCPGCECRFQTRIRVECQCGTGGLGPLLEYAVVHPTVVSFFDRQELGPTQIGPWRYRLTAFEHVEETVVVSDAPEVAFEFRHAGDNCRLTVRGGSHELAFDANH